jgi:hypothetical protein
MSGVPQAAGVGLRIEASSAIDWRGAPAATALLLHSVGLRRSVDDLYRNACRLMPATARYAPVREAGQAVLFWTSITTKCR